MRFAALLPILTALAYTATSSAAPTTHPTDLLQPRYIKPNITHIDCSNDPYEHAPGKVNVWFEGVDEITGQTAQIRSGVPEHCGSTWRFDPATMEDNRFAVRKGGKYYLVSGVCYNLSRLPVVSCRRDAIKRRSGIDLKVRKCIS
jgi:hypothetical protein